MLIGIDLGTTNSAVAIWQDEAPQLVPNALGEVLTPSAVSIDTDGQTLIGQAALERMATHPADTVTSFKRFMGTSRTVKLGKRTFAPDELSALVLMALVSDVEAQTDTRPHEAVITVPAYFNDRQRKATHRAGELAGLEVKRLINEPTAAALAFGLATRGDREPFLVFDLGGGTFDVSVVEMFDGIVEVRASGGDNRLGGDDFNHALISLMEPRIDPLGLLKTIPADRRAAQLFQAAERTRRRLSETDKAEFAVALADQRLSAQVTADEFEQAASDLIARLRDPVARALRDCAIDAASLSEIVMVGGSTRMPVVRRALTRMFGRFPNATVHPDHAVALGAAIQAGLLSRGDGLDEIRITDVCPFTLGVDSAQKDARGTLLTGLFSPIIDRNTPVPVSRIETYQTVSDNQRQLEFEIYQGESREVSGNIALGKLSVPIPPRPAGEITADVRFSYDSSGLLEVDVTIPSSGLTRNLVIVSEDDRSDAMGLEQRRAALAKLKFHPRETTENITLMARAERCYEGCIGDERQMVGRWIADFTGALERQDPRQISEGRQQLAGLLDQIDLHAPL